MNFAYADTGPNIGPNQAQKIAQNYLNTHNFPYKANTPHDSNLQVRVKDIKSEKVI
ncbi:MAG: hypothetical protein PHY59_00410 [Methanobacterium sp.]|nr:hypothetical protein [Methanobacterium sp.]